jgi:hypothetical protein
MALIDIRLACTAGIFVPKKQDANGSSSREAEREPGLQKGW